MQYKPNPISGVPTNIITGFLGVGKTSTILQLLKAKPSNERWAVLVNEFGEIGIDGALFEGQHTEQNGVYIREVPGGCMCCTAGQPMRVALAQLLRRAKPDRLLIEPTGLGHPSEVLQTLNDADFQGVLSVQNIVTLMDARHLSDSRYVEHETFQQQIEIADIIVANKQDQYTAEDKAALEVYLKKTLQKEVALVFTEQGLIDPSLLDGGCTTSILVSSIVSSTKGVTETTTKVSTQETVNIHHATFDTSYRNVESTLPECGYVKALNHGEGFVSVGWRFSTQFQFDQSKLFAFLSGVDSERLKATFRTSNGCFAYNAAKGTLTENTIESLEQSRIEIIANELNDEWEQALFACVISEENSISIN